jgi:calcineurin-like phosphoesterase family protein
MDKLNITLKEGQRIWFTSDQHFGHRNVLRFCHRPWEDVKDMGQSIINNWNEVVSDNDICFILGDMCWWESRHDVKRVMDKLKGSVIYVVPGNHCTRRSYELCDERIKLLDDVSAIYLRYEGSDKILKEIYVSHIPLMTWPHRERGSINLFGHIHSGPKTECQCDQDLPLWKGQQYDVGVDNNEYYPISYDDIVIKLNE